jgi:hypothetical protein
MSRSQSLFENLKSLSGDLGEQPTGNTSILVRGFIGNKKKKDHYLCQIILKRIFQG